MSTPTPPKSGDNSGVIVLLLLAAGVGGYFLFLHSRAAKVEDLVGEWSGTAKPWTIRFEKEGDILMRTIGSVSSGSFTLDADGGLKVVMADGKRFQAKATMRNGELTLTDPDGSATSFKSVKPPTLTAPGRAANPGPQPVGPSIAGRWVSTEFAEEVLELSPDGGAKRTGRGEAYSSVGTYQYGGGVLRMTLNMLQGKRTVDNTVESLKADELTFHFPRLVGLREEKRTVYLRIDPSSYTDTRTKLLGRWQGTGKDRELIEFGADDTIRVTINGALSAGIFRVMGTTLETYIRTPRGGTVQRRTVDSVSGAALVLTGAAPGERGEYQRAK